MSGHDIRWDEIVELMDELGGEAYFGEPVSQAEHALQAAWFARQAGSAPSLVAAALLHDIGHLLHGLSEDVAGQSVDARHERVGYDWLLARFGPAVAEPVRSHVAAKRYLCAIDVEYGEALSAASQQSLALQGGPMSADEVREFSRSPWCQDAVALRRWDDAAKTPGLKVPDLSYYRSRMERVAGNRL